MSVEVRSYRHIDKGATDETVLTSLNTLTRRELLALKQDADRIVGKDTFGCLATWILIIAMALEGHGLWLDRLLPFGFLAAMECLVIGVQMLLFVNIKRDRKKSRFLVRRAIRMQRLIAKSYERFEITLVA
ncbi:MAG TPA: hypothetical protein VN081_04855 [Dongiaceae bacterium]|nr:hypothetical protein [Dongiaceae bacterium]